MAASSTKEATRARFHPTPDWQSGDVFLSRGPGVTSRPLLAQPLPTPKQSGGDTDMVGDGAIIPTLFGLPIPPPTAATNVGGWLRSLPSRVAKRLKSASGRTLSDSIVWIDGGPHSHGSIGVRNVGGSGRDVSLDVGAREQVVAFSDIEPYFEQRVNLQVLRHVAMAGESPSLTPEQVKAAAEALAATYNDDPERGFAMRSLVFLGVRMFTLNDDRNGLVERAWKRFLEHIIIGSRPNDTFCTGFVAQVFDRVGHPLLVMVDPGYIDGLRSMWERGPLDDTRFLTKMGPPGHELSANGDPVAVEQLSRLLTADRLSAGPIELAFTDTHPDAYDGPGQPVPTLLCTPRLAHDSHSLRLVGRVFPDAASQESASAGG